MHTNSNALLNVTEIQSVLLFILSEICQKCYFNKMLPT